MLRARLSTIPTIALLCTLFSARILSTVDIPEYDENVPKAFYTWFDLSPSNFSKEKLSQKYKKLARNYHPDKCKEEGCSEAFLKISKAFDILSDQRKKSLYDRGGVKAVDSAEGASGFDHSHAEDIFAQMFEEMFSGSPFGGSGGRRRRRNVTQEELYISLQDVAVSRSKSLQYNRIKQCSGCGGSGAHSPADIQMCPDCRGRGVQIQDIQVLHGVYQRVQIQCGKCSGSGKSISRSCSKCAGNGHVKEQKNLSIEIPPGAQDSQVVWMEGEGNSDENGPGDLAVILRIEEDPFWERDGLNLYATVTINLRQALLGFTIHLRLLDQSKLTLNRSNVTQPQFVDEYKGKGLIGADGRKGTVYIKYSIVLPATINKDQRKQFDLLLTPALPIHDDL